MSYPSHFAVIGPVIDLIGALIAALLVGYGSRRTMWHGLTHDSLVAFIRHTQRFFRPVSGVSEEFNILKSAMTSSKRIFELLHTPVDMAVPARPRQRGLRTSCRAGGVALQDVFPSSGNVEENLRLGEISIPQEQLVAAAREVEDERSIRRRIGAVE